MLLSNQNLKKSYSAVQCEMWKCFVKWNKSETNELTQGTKEMVEPPKCSWAIDALDQNKSSSSIIWFFTISTMKHLLNVIYALTVCFGTIFNQMADYFWRGFEIFVELMFFLVENADNLSNVP